MPDPARPDDDGRAARRGRRSAVSRSWPLRALRIAAIALLLLFVVAQIAGNVGGGTGGAGSSTRLQGTSHLDEARGHLNSILDLFR